MFKYSLLYMRGCCINTNVNLNNILHSRASAVIDAGCKFDFEMDNYAVSLISNVYKLRRNELRHLNV